MKRTAVMLAVTLVVGIALGVIGSRSLNAEQQPLKRTMLLLLYSGRRCAQRQKHQCDRSAQASGILDC
ncbi:MAG: hypothetical protein HW376_733 [candidate division NC10 bacterium]|nr:hypothetical protein [candidate division NC10 bacterium]